MYFLKMYIKKKSNINISHKTVPTTDKTDISGFNRRKKKTKIENKEVQLHKQMSLHVNAFLLLAATSISVS